MTFHVRSYHVLAIVAGILLASIGAGSALAAVAQPVPTCQVDKAMELMITDLSVVEDCIRTTWGPCVITPGPSATQGAWTFGKLMEGIFGTTDPRILSKQVLAWLAHWESDQVINGDTVRARPAIRSLVTDPWLLASGNDNFLNMKLAPMRLLAIVARIDLRQSPTYGNGNAGEARFVFGVLDSNGNPTSFTVILEYGLVASTCQDIKDWALAFHSLGSFATFDESYKQALQDITDLFTSINGDPSKPNGSSLNQLRTNEIALSSPWELREFRLQANPDGTAPFKESTVAQTPEGPELIPGGDPGHQGTQLLADYILENEADILNNQHVVPLIFHHQTFRGGAAPHALQLGWDGPPPTCSSFTTPSSLEARHIFSLNTCSGCHGATETGTFFLQITPRSAGVESSLAGFLTGITTTDLCGLSHSFDDLGRRADDLCDVIEKSCPDLLAETPTNRVH